MYIYFAINICVNYSFLKLKTYIINKIYKYIVYIIGIIPSVNECDNTPKPTVFTRIGPHLDWILQQTKDACYCTK